MKHSFSMVGIAWWVMGCGQAGPQVEVPQEQDTRDPALIEPYEPGEPGPYRVGVETMSFVDERGKELVLEVWYPGDPGPTAEPDPYELPLVLNAFWNANPDLRGAPYPLIAFSHGLGGIRFQSASLAEHLASHGYVIVSPDHPGSILLDIHEDRLGEIAVERPGDVILAVDHVIGLSDGDHPRLAGMVDGESYAMMGHSFGAVTTLAAAGGELNVPYMQEFCDEVGGSGCQFLRQLTEEMIATAVGPDPRIRAAVPLSPGAWYAFGEEGAGLAAMPPSLVMAGTRDGVLRYEKEALPVYEAMADKAWLATLEGAGHYAAFSDMCRLIPVFEDCKEDEGFLPSTVGQAITEHVVTAWLGWQFKGEEAYAEWLEPEALEAFPALTLEGGD